jgi:outer membrane receptor protein involved in Fe transport
MLKKSILLFSGLWLFAMFSLFCSAQSITSGDVAGTVTDPSGAAIPGAAVTLTNLSTNTSQKAATNSEGGYRFAFVSPGTYKLTISANGFQTQERPGVVVTPGQPTPVSVQLALAGASQTVEVVEAPTALQTENADVATAFSQNMIENLPNPGGDITYVAQTAPGVVMNTQSGYGNFSADGMPGTSNLFTINGQNYNDPYLNLNNSGASNLLLGANDIAEANVINNAYSAQYGQYAGTQVSYITKSGTNQFHGDAIYDWNGRAMNANQFFSNESGSPRPFNNFNQWATGVSGPIWKNRTFFDVDYEGLRSIIPTSSNLTLIPSQQFQAATLANLAATGNSAEIPFYNQIFKIYNGAPGAGGAVPVTSDGDGGCGGLTFTGLAPGAPCALQFRTTPPNLYHEYQWASRVDHIFSDKDRGYVRVLRDNGYQPTYTSPLGPTFNAQSLQPQMSGQVSEIHTFGPNTINQFNGSVLFYAAIFGSNDQSAALAALPTFLNFSGSNFAPVGADQECCGFFFPQGRRVFQYQVSDDFSKAMGRHTFRMGFSWLHDSVTDEAFQENVHGWETTSLTDFFNGGGPSSSLNQYFPTSPEEGLRFNTIGGYVADDWKVTDRLTVSLNFRLEHYANPACDSNCFSRLTTTFGGAQNLSAASTPYNQFIEFGQHNAYANTQPVVYEPRVGIAFKPFHNDRTVIRTGAGVFADTLEGQVAELAALNLPNLVPITVGNGTLAPGVPGSLFSTATESNAALQSQFKSGGSFNTISQAVPGFSPPNFNSFPTKMNQPTYYKWNFEIQQNIGAKTVVSLNYSGMHGIHIPVPDEGLNAFCPPSTCPNGFVGLPAAAPNPALGQVTQYISAGTANYNGLTISVQRRLSAGLTFNANYTWSHALDDVSNGGQNEQFAPSGLITDPSIPVPVNPFNLRANYGNADYDVRNYFSASMVLSDMFRHAGFKWGPNAIFGGWTLSSNWFYRSGLPFSIIDNSAQGALLGYNLGAQSVVLASPLGNIPGTCTSAVNTPCLNTSQFAPSAAAAGFPTGFGTIGRNSIYGPHFFDVDIAIMKEIKIRERLTFSFGAQAYNAFNHPNFDQPVNDISNPNFGSSVSEVGPPTSILGSFVGGGNSPRFIEVRGIVRF